MRKRRNTDVGDSLDMIVTALLTPMIWLIGLIWPPPDKHKQNDEAA